MRSIKLYDGRYKGLETQVADEDYAKHAKHVWYPLKGKKTYYAYRTYRVPAQKKSVVVYLHREILGITDPTVFVDHIDGNGLNNLPENLRASNRELNGANSRKRETYGGVKTTSQYKGVYWFRREGIWVVRAGQQYVGRFTDEIEAAKAYDRAARERWGEHAKLNFPDDEVLAKAA